MYFPRKIIFLSGNMIFPKGVNLHISLAIMQKMYNVTRGTACGYFWLLDFVLLKHFVHCNFETC